MTIISTYKNTTKRFCDNMCKIEKLFSIKWKQKKQMLEITLIEF